MLYIIMLDQYFTTSTTCWMAVHALYYYAGPVLHYIYYMLDGSACSILLCWTSTSLHLLHAGWQCMLYIIMLDQYFTTSTTCWMAVHALYYYAGPVLHSTATLIFQQQHCEVHSWTSSTLATRSLCVSPQNGRNTCLHYAQKLLTPVEIFVALQNPIQKWHGCHNLVTTLLLFVVVWNDIQQSCQEKVKESCTAANEDMKKFGRSRDYMMKRLTDTDIKKLIERT